MMHLLQQDGRVRADSTSGESADPPPHLPAKCRRVIHLYYVRRPQSSRFVRLQAGAREALTASRSRAPRTPETFFGKIGLLRKNDWEFKQRGESGLWVSDLFPHHRERRR